MHISCLLTARGNNTLKNKNILDILGHPVVYYPASEGKKSQLTSSWFASSDSDDILDISERLGYCPIKRPEALARPESQHVDTILHGLEIIRKKLAFTPEIIVVILGNNLTIKGKWIDECIGILQRDYQDISAVVPVYSDSDHNPFRAKKISEKGILVPFMQTPQKISTNRQDLPGSYFLAHNFWVLNTKYLLSGEIGYPPWGFMGNQVVPYKIERSIDIHDVFDLGVAELWLKEQRTE
jgi:CMP-N-acetylneuraminic acid synthetase